MSEFNFNMLVKKSQNYSPSSLMHNYAQQHPSTSFGYDKYGQAYLELANVRYFFDHWSTRSISQHSEMVTVFLTDIHLIPMPGTQGNWGEKHWGKESTDA